MKNVEVLLTLPRLLKKVRPYNHGFFPFYKLHPCCVLSHLSARGSTAPSAHRDPHVIHIPHSQLKQMPRGYGSCLLTLCRSVIYLILTQMTFFKKNKDLYCKTVISLLPLVRKETLHGLLRLWRHLWSEKYSHSTKHLFVTGHHPDASLVGLRLWKVIYSSAQKHAANIFLTLVLAFN